MVSIDLSGVRSCCSFSISSRRLSFKLRQCIFHGLIADRTIWTFGPPKAIQVLSVASSFLWTVTVCRLCVHRETFLRSVPVVLTIFQRFIQLCADIYPNYSAFNRYHVSHNVYDIIGNRARNTHQQPTPFLAAFALMIRR